MINAPWSRAAGLAAVVNASRRFVGPSASGASELRCAPVSTTGGDPLYVRSSHIAVSSMVSVPWVITTPSAPPATALSTAEPMASQSAGVSWELSFFIKSTTSTSRPAASSAPPTVGRRTPLGSVLVAMVPPVVITTRRAVLGWALVVAMAGPNMLAASPAATVMAINRLFIVLTFPPPRSGRDR
jgi:hypothetical protein